jgi:cytidylate kinase
MCVITISGGWFRGGERFAEGLARRLGFQLITRESVIQSATLAGAPEKELREALESPPTLFDRLITHKRYIYLTQIQAALAEAVREGNAVYSGYAGHLLLADAGPLLRIRIIASEDLRLRTIQEDMKLTREEAVAHIHRVDVQRKKWTRYLYGVDWEDPKLYDMVLNLGHVMQVSDACDMVVGLARDHRCFEMTSERRAELRDFALACRVRAVLAIEAPHTNLKVSEITSHRGNVKIESTLDDTEQITEIERIVRAVPEVRDVDLRY